MIRRLARAIVAFGALSSLLLAGAGTVVASSVSAPMRGLATSDLSMVASELCEPGSTGGSSSAVPSTDDSPCEHGTTPLRCISAPACTAFVAVQAEVSRADAAALPRARMAPMVVLEPASITTAPDLRPPRA